MTDYSALEEELRKTVGLDRRPVAVAFRSSPPPGVPKFAGRAPSGCSFFGIAAGGMTFYTIAEDHHACAIGTYAYNLDLPSQHAEIMADSIASLRTVCSIDADEVRSLPRTPNNPEVVVFSPLGQTPVDPDIVVLVVRPLQGMFIQEAAMRRHIGIHIAPLSRPTCMSLHFVMEDKAVTSAGCIGNRVYNGLEDDEMYMLLPGRLLKTMAEEIELIATANHKLAFEYLLQRDAMETFLE